MMDFLIVWNADPELIRLGPLAVRWYGLLYASSFLIGTLLMSWIFRREGKPQETVDRLLLYMLIAVIGGARLGEMLFYNPSFYFSHPLEIIKVWKGGLSSHGAFFAILVALYIYTKKTPGQPYLWLFDRIVIIVSLGASLIRVGNFFNSEIIGKPTHSNWGVVFTRIDNLPRHPAQLYESASYFLIFWILLFLYLKLDTIKKQGLLFGIFLSLAFASRFLIEFLKENQAAFEETLPLNMGQILSIPGFALGVFLIVYSLKRTVPVETDRKKAAGKKKRQKKSK